MKTVTDKNLSELEKNACEQVDSSDLYDRADVGKTGIDCNGSGY
jgi:hypothetical protein